MRKHKIILAEDNLEHQILLKHALTKNRPEVEVSLVSTAADFELEIRKNQYDCAVIDYNLPDSKADELIGKTERTINNCPVLVVSSSEAQNVVISCARSGSADFVPKSDALAKDVLWGRVKFAIDEVRKKRLEDKKREHRQNVMARLAERDPLTGLYNRYYLNRQFKENSFLRDRRQKMCCVMIDVDHFKEVNDLHGHGASDRILQGVSSSILELLHRGDAAIRWGGEEFLILLSSTGLFSAWHWAEKLRSKIEQKKFKCNDKEISVTLSLGIVHFPTCQMGYEIIDNADQAMYLAKQNGRNRVCTWNMVVIDKVLKQLEGNTTSTPEQQRELFISLCNNILSPTQKMHLTFHCQDVAKLATMLGKNLELSDKQLNDLHLSGLLHDIGKSLVPDELLCYAGPLTRQQWAFMRTHPEHGAHIATRLGANPNVVHCVEHHHFPYQHENQKSNTSLNSRIVSVADAYSALMMERSYRSACSKDDALTYLRSGSGTQFDPSIVASAHYIFKDS